MGIRIHKQLGWGLTDVKTNGYRIVDDRFNMEKYEYFKENPTEAINSFAKWVSENREEAMSIVKEVDGDKNSWAVNTVVWADDVVDRQRKIDFFHLMTHDGEYGLKNVFCCSPVHSPHFCRYDDIIDYTESRQRGIKKDCNYIVKLNETGIWPYENFFLLPNRKVPDEFKDVLKESIDLFRAQIMLREQKNEDYSRYPKDLIGFFIENYRPQIDDSVMLLTRHAGIFNDWSKTIQEFRPMLYVYWG